MSKGTGLSLGWIGIIVALIGIFWAPLWLGAIAFILGITALATSSASAQGTAIVSIVLGIIVFFWPLFA